MMDKRRRKTLAKVLSIQRNLKTYLKLLSFNKTGSVSLKEHKMFIKIMLELTECFESEIELYQDLVNAKPEKKC